MMRPSLPPISSAEILLNMALARRMAVPFPALGLEPVGDHIGQRFAVFESSIQPIILSTVRSMVSEPYSSKSSAE